MENHYLILLKDSFMVSLNPTLNEYVMPAMLYYKDKFDPAMIAVVAMVGYIAALLLYYLAGRLAIRLILCFPHFKPYEARYQQWSKKTSRYSFAVLLAAFNGLEIGVALFSGILRLHPGWFMLFLIVAKALYIAYRFALWG